MFPWWLGLGAGADCLEPDDKRIAAGLALEDGDDMAGRLAGVDLFHVALTDGAADLDRKGLGWHDRSRRLALAA